MSEPFATLPFMGIRRLFLLFVLVLVAAGCGGGNDEDVSATTVPLTVPSTSSTSSTTTTTSTNTTEAPVTNTSVEDEVEAEPTDASGIELTITEEGTPEADVERAFWAGSAVREVIFTEDMRDAEYPPLLATHTGASLETLQESIAQWVADDWWQVNTMPAEIEIGDLLIREEDRALLRMCRLSHIETWVSGELFDAGSVDSEFQITLRLVDGEWLTSQIDRFRQEVLEDGERPACLSGSTS